MVPPLPISAVIATKDRAESLARTLDSLAEQGMFPSELIVVDGSTGDETKSALEQWGTRVGAERGVHAASTSEPTTPTKRAEARVPMSRWVRAEQLGAAIQRNQGVALATQPFVWFFDDDIRFEPECVRRLWTAIQSDARLGGVNAMIVNQKYHPPGALSRIMFALMNGRREKNYAGRVLGPAVNLLPDDRDDLPEVVPVEWLNTTCTMYRREALPSPVFDSVFTGYSMMEDLTLSLRVGRQWKLANARTARIFHDSQPGAHKADARALAEMELVNRRYVVLQILGRRGLAIHLKMWLWELFCLASSLPSAEGRRSFFARLAGQCRAMGKIYFRGARA